MSEVAAPTPERAAPPADRWVALIGNPNTGKTTLFNALTGGRARTGNYPGVTVDKTVGSIRLAQGGHLRVLDLPGTYSLAARSPDEMLAVDVLLGRREDTARPEAVAVVVDATNLERNLYLVTQVMETGLPTVVVLNMMDGAESRGITIDAAALAERLGVRVVPTVASRGRGVADVGRALAEVLDETPGALPWSWPETVADAELELGRRLEEAGMGAVPRLEGRRALLDVGGEAERRLVADGGEAARRAIDEARAIVTAGGEPLAALEARVRYAFIADVAAACLRRPAEEPATVSDRIDAVLTHRLLGSLVLLVVMSVVFMAIFAWSGPLMEFIDGTLFGGLAEMVSGWAWLGDGALKSLVVDGVIAGVGGVLVFLPQILILFGFIALLEGCGYMARAAFLMDRLLRWCGLSGRSFIPMLSSFACAVPGVMAARTIESRRDRIVTILVAPLMSCSARIPVYVVLIGAFVPAATVLGFLNLQGLVFGAMYLVGIVVAIPVAFLLKRTLLRSETPSFLVELPPYRWPQARIVARRMLEQGKAFVVRAGTLIFAASIVVWALATWPASDAQAPQAEARRAALAREQDESLERLEAERARQAQAVEAARAQSEDLGRVAEEAYQAWLATDYETRREEAAEAEAELEGRLEAEAAGEQLRQSALGRMGRVVEPVFAPIGWDWKVSAAVLASFPAREVVVSTLGILYNLGDETDEESETLREQLQGAVWESGPRKGEKVFDLAAAIALMVFFALCAQCASTLVMIRRETGRWGWAAFSFVYMTAFAYVGALVTAVVLRALL